MKIKFFIIVSAILFAVFSFGCAATKPSLLNSSKQGNIEEIKSLLKSGKDVNEQDEHGITALMYASMRNKMDTVKHLIQSGADVKRRDKDSSDALMYCLMSGYNNIEMIELLLDNGADVNGKNSIGHTPIMMTVYANGTLNIAKLLIKRGADLTVKEPVTSKSLYDYAVYYKNPAIAGEIKEALSQVGNIPYESKLVFIRPSNVFNMAKYIDININNRILILGNDSIEALEIGQGRVEIIIKGTGWVNIEGEYRVLLNAEKGKTYYYEIMPRTGNVVSRHIGILGGPAGLFLGMSIESSFSGDKAGPFEIIPLEEVEAQAKIKELGKKK